uniref:Uncharacterized protein n=1 Tax=Globisporangium ultimum (strain ATCC 200006 / CBS 805.95 / DAOM BR144) TaxID=431595 RepID=K3W6Q2_GLOUD
MAKQHLRALIERFDAGTIAARQHRAFVSEVVEGTVQELIEKFNGMSRSIPDVPRPVYRSTWSLRATVSSVVMDDEDEQSDLLQDDDDENPDAAEMHDEQDAQDGAEQQRLQDEHAIATDDDDVEHDNDEGDEEEGLSTCDETASIHSLSSSFVSDSSCEDYHHDATLYYELEYQHAFQFPQDEEVIAVHAPQDVEEESVLSPEDTKHTLCEETPVAEPKSVDNGRYTRPQERMPSKIPVLKRTAIPATPTKSASRIPTPVSGKAIREPRTASPPTSSPRRERRVVDKIPSRLVKSCPRFSSLTNTSSPRKPVTPYSSERRRRPLSERNTKSAPGPTTAIANFKASIAAAARSTAVARPQASRKSEPAIPTATAAPKPRARSSSSGSKPNSLPSRPRVESSARPSTPPPSTQDICLDRIKSRLFDYENDPKRLEMVAANRARRKSLEARKNQVA